MSHCLSPWLATRVSRAASTLECACRNLLLSLICKNVGSIVPQISIHHQKIMSTLTATLVVLLCCASSACAAAAVTVASVAPTPPLQLREAFNERAKAFLSDVVENDRSHDTYAELTRLALGKQGVTGAGMQSSFAKMWARQVATARLLLLQCSVL